MKYILVSEGLARAGRLFKAQTTSNYSPQVYKNLRRKEAESEERTAIKVKKDKSYLKKGTHRGQLQKHMNLASRRDEASGYPKNHERSSVKKYIKDNVNENRSPDPSEPGATNRELKKSLGPGDNANDNDSGSPLTKGQQRKANAGIRRWKQSYDTKKFRKHLGQPENRDKGFGKLHQKEKNFNLKQTLRKKKVNEGLAEYKKWDRHNRSDQMPHYKYARRSNHMMNRGIKTKKNQSPDEKKSIRSKNLAKRENEPHRMNALAIKGKLRQVKEGFQKNLRRLVSKNASGDTRDTNYFKSKHRVEQINNRGIHKNILGHQGNVGRFMAAASSSSQGHKKFKRAKNAFKKQYTSIAKKQGLVGEGTLGKKATSRRMKVMAHRGASTPSIVKRFLAHRKSKKASPKGEKQERGTPLNKFVDKFGTGK